jgi:60 kDa SS-A/Ro ribonucleoprotein
MKYNAIFKQRTQTPQNAPIPGKRMVRNSNAGYSFEVDLWQRLKRFTVLGSEAGSYYASEQTLTLENANNVLDCIRMDGQRVVRETAAISDEGRAPKNTPAIFVLALAAAKGDEATRRAALAAMPKVCRTGTHLFQFAEYVQTFRGWGRGLRRGVASWYTAQTPRNLAYQAVKYRQRDGWTHADLLRLAHPKPGGETQGALFKWITRPEEAGWARDLGKPEDEALAFVWAFEHMQEAQNVETVLKLIQEYDLPREALPTQWLNEPSVWAMLLAKMPMTAMLRNLGVMARVGLLTPFSGAEATIIERLGNADLLRKARVHPIAVLSALRVYAQGRGMRSDATWKPTARVVDALDSAFYLAFKNVEPANKRLMLALDVSGSMSAGVIAGVPGLTPRDASAALALVTARTEPQYTIISFQDKIVPLNISARMRLDDAIKATSNLPFGATDCAQPMLYALDKKLMVDTFVIFTDSETWFNPQIHPVEALWKYRQEMGIPAQLVVVGIVANRFTIADPDDVGMLDVVGMDTATPQVITDFARGEI